MSLDPESLAAEQARLAPAFEYVDRHADAFVERLQRLARLPSVSAHLQSLPETADLRPQFARLRDATKYGDPLYFAKTVGSGRVTVVLTTAGTSGHKTPGGAAGRRT